MNVENEKRIQDAVKIAGDCLDGKLPINPFFPKRNPHAHLWERIKFHMGKSYKDCADEDVDTILEIIEIHKNNPI